MTTAEPVRILVLEDEWMIAEQIQLALAEAGYEVVGPVGQIDQALNLVATTPVNGAVLDINLHGERSYEVAEALAKTATPFVFLSGYLGSDLPEAFRERPVLTKPVDIAGLCRCVDTLLSAP